MTYVQPVGDLEDIDEMKIAVGVDYDTVTVDAGGTLLRLTAEQAEDFAALFVTACWQAGRNAERMAWEAKADAE